MLISEPLQLVRPALLLSRFEKAHKLIPTPLSAPLSLLSSVLKDQTASLSSRSSSTSATKWIPSLESELSPGRKQMDTSARLARIILDSLENVSIVFNR